MRGWEIAMISACTLTLALSRVVPQYGRLSATLAMLVALVSASTGFRWHLAPTYLLVGAAMGLAWCLPTILAHPLSLMAGGLLVALTLGLCWAFPIFDLPKPPGPWAIGIDTIVFADPSRNPRGGRADGSGPRELVVDFWYPAASPADDGTAHAPKEPYTTVPSKRFSNLLYVQTHARRSLRPDSSTTHPVILFSPSWNGTRREAIVLCEALASEGYIVAAIDHPYGSWVTRFPDGRQIQAPANTWFDLSSEASYAATRPYVEEQLKVRVADIRFLLDRLSETGSGRAFAGLAGPFAAMGFSFGGSAAVEATLEDSRLVAASDMDGLLSGRSASEGSPRPVLFFSSEPEPFEQWLEAIRQDPSRRTEFRVQDAAWQTMNRSVRDHGGYLLFVAGSNHVDFTDAPLYSRLRRFSGSGAVKPDEMLQIVVEYTIDFFNQQLRRKPARLLQASRAPFPEVIMRAPAESAR